MTRGAPCTGPALLCLGTRAWEVSGPLSPLRHLGNQALTWGPVIPNPSFCAPLMTLTTRSLARVHTADGETESALAEPGQGGAVWQPQAGPWSQGP